MADVGRLTPCWVQVYLPSAGPGWIEFDPTNGIVAPATLSAGQWREIRARRSAARHLYRPGRCLWSDKLGWSHFFLKETWFVAGEQGDGSGADSARELLEPKRSVREPFKMSIEVGVRDEATKPTPDF